MFKERNKHRIPGAESGRGTLTTFRLLKESVRPTDFPRPALEGVPGAANPGAGDAEGRGLPAVSPATRAERAGAPAEVIPCQSRGSRQGRAPSPRGTKVGLTPSAARRGSRRLGQPDQEPRVRPRAERAACGGGDEPRHPSHRRAPRDLLIKISTYSRHWFVSYLCATAAANPPAPATPTHRTNDSSPAALKIPDKESRNSRFPTSQSLDPASAPPPVAAVATAAAASSNSLHLETARDRPPRPPRDRARAPGTLAQLGRLS